MTSIIRNGLNADEAVSLWLRGEDAWNQWAKSCGDSTVNVDFVGVDFSKYVPEDGVISFKNFIFPKGTTFFSGSKFLAGDVIFEDAIFSGGRLAFVDCEFGNVNVSFAGTIFHTSSISITQTTFGEGKVSFHKAEFTAGGLYFSGIDFGDGGIGFPGAKVNGNIDFYQVNFGTGNVQFQKSEISGNLSFIDVKFGKGELLCHKMEVKGAVTFILNSKPDLTKFDLSSVSIDGELSFSDFETNCVIDLRHSKLSRPIDLDQVKIGFKTVKSDTHGFRRQYDKAVDIEDSTRFRRLKKLAKDADDFERQLEFFANEMRASYGHSLTGARLALYLAYDQLSNYGRSISKPALDLLSTLIAFSLIYFDISMIWLHQKGGAPIDILPHLGTSIVFSLTQTLPIYIGSRTAYSDTLNSLFQNNTIPDWLHLFTITQGIISAVFIFLIALGLRNNFRS